MKLEVTKLPAGKVQIRGKAWPVGEAEPVGWLIDHVDPLGNRRGSPGIFAYAPNDVFRQFKGYPKSITTRLLESERHDENKQKY
jgi:hypothetical protein